MSYVGAHLRPRPSLRVAFGGLAVLGVVAFHRQLAHRDQAATRAGSSPMVAPPTVQARPVVPLAAKNSRAWRGRALVAAGAALVMVCLPSVAHALVPPAAPVQASVPSVPIAAPVRVALAAPLSVPVPVRIHIPAIRLASQLVRLDLGTDGRLQPLTDVDRPGWYAGGPLPGEPGAALIVGHVDSYEGPAVFQKLEKLQPGDLIAVQRADGSLIRFVVSRLASYRKDHFPTAAVFAATTPELRLITCFGSFDRARKSYTSNLVVYASLLAPVHLPAQSRQRTATHQKELL